MSKNLKIIDYFDSLANQVDIKANKLLTEFSLLNQQKIPNEDQLIVNLINQRRKSFIATIENIKQHNFEFFKDPIDQNDDENPIFDKFCFILDKFFMKEYISKLDVFDGILYSNEFHINATFGYLIVVEDGCLTEKELALFKEIIYYGYAIEQDLENYDYREIKDFKFIFTFYKYYDKYNSTESNIFNAKLVEVLVGILNM